MDLANIISIYGKPIIEECTFCKGEGCEACAGFGYIAHSANRETKYMFEYPLFVEVKKRTDAALLKNAIILSLTFLFIAALVVSYLINFVQNG